MARESGVVDISLRLTGGWTYMNTKYNDSAHRRGRPHDHGDRGGFHFGVVPSQGKRLLQCLGGAYRTKIPPAHLL